MASDLVSLNDAAQVLGVSAERVRQLVVAGDLPGVRFGNAGCAADVARGQGGVISHVGGGRWVPVGRGRGSSQGMWISMTSAGFVIERWFIATR